VPKNEPKTNIGLIIAVLYSNKGLFFSAREISEIIKDEYLIILTPPTIRIYLKDIEPILLTRIDRYGCKRLPLKLYALPE
jgi:hypothetical protein